MSTIALKSHAAELRTIWPGFWTHPTFGFSDGDSLELVTAVTQPPQSIALTCDKPLEQLAAGSWIGLTHNAALRPLLDSRGELAGIVVRVKPTILASVDLAAHESFHMYQLTHFTDFLGDSLVRVIDLEKTLTPDFAGSTRQEMLLLADAIDAPRGNVRSGLLGRYLSTRRSRLRNLVAIAAIERRMERVEGTAEYVGRSASAVSQDSPGPSVRRSQLALALRKLAANLAKDPAAIRDLRPRTYLTGAGMALLLEDSPSGWQSAVECGTPLDSLLERKLGVP